MECGVDYVKASIGILDATAVHANEDIAKAAKDRTVFA